MSRFRTITREKADTTTESDPDEIETTMGTKKPLSPATLARSSSSRIRSGSIGTETILKRRNSFDSASTLIIRNNKPEVSKISILKDGSKRILKKDPSFGLNTDTSPLTERSIMFEEDNDENNNK